MSNSGEQCLQANQCEQIKDHQGYRNGYKPKTVNTRIVEVKSLIPQVRLGGFYTSAIEKGMVSQRTLLIALAEKHIEGVFTIKKLVVLKIIEDHYSPTGIMIIASLSQMYAVRRFLGGWEYEQDDLTYHDTSDGNLECFTGLEWIEKDGIKVYELLYHGGLII